MHALVASAGGKLLTEIDRVLRPGGFCICHCMGAAAFAIVTCHCMFVLAANAGGKFLTEIDRVLRPGGFWVLTGPPIHWRRFAAGWKRSKESLRAEQEELERVAAGLCWEKFKEEGIFGVWRKPEHRDANVCLRRKRKKPIHAGPPLLCPLQQDPDFAWYVFAQLFFALPFVFYLFGAGASSRALPLLPLSLSPTSVPVRRRHTPLSKCISTKAPRASRVGAI